MKKIQKILLLGILSLLILVPVQAKVITKVKSIPKKTTVVTTKKLGSSPTVNSYYVTNPVTSNFLGSLLPQTTNVYDLGSASKQWRNLYVGGSVSSATGTFGSITITTSSILNLYISTSGTDSGLCQSTSTPCLTVAYAKNQIPMLLGNNEVDVTALKEGAYDATENGIGISPGGKLSANYGITILKFIGASSTNPNATIFQGADNGNRCWELTDASSEYYFKNLTISKCSTALNVVGSRVFLEGVTLSNFSTGLNLGNDRATLGYAQFVASTNPMTFNPNSGGIPINVGVNGVVENNNLVVTMNTTTATAISVSNGGKYRNLAGASSVLNINGNTATSTSFGLVVGSQGIINSGGTINFSHINLFATSSVAIIVNSGGIFTPGASPVFNFTSTSVGIDVRPGGIYQESIGQPASYNWGDTTIPVRLSDGGIILTNGYLTSTNTTYIAPNGEENSEFGYDRRYGQLAATNTWSNTNLLRGAFAQNYKQVDASTYNVLGTDGYLAASSTSVTATYTLPNASTVSAGFTITLKDRSSRARQNKINVISSSTIDTVTSSFAIDKNGAEYQFVADGISNWETAKLTEGAPEVFNQTQFVTNAMIWTGSATTSGGVATFIPTSDGTASGTAKFNTIFSVNCTASANVSAATSTPLASVKNILPDKTKIFVNVVTGKTLLAVGDTAAFASDSTTAYCTIIGN